MLNLTLQIKLQQSLNEKWLALFIKRMRKLKLKHANSRG